MFFTITINASCAFPTKINFYSTTNFSCYFSINRKNLPSFFTNIFLFSLFTHFFIFILSKICCMSTNIIIKNNMHYDAVRFGFNLNDDDLFNTNSADLHIERKDASTFEERNPKMSSRHVH